MKSHNDVDDDWVPVCDEDYSTGITIGDRFYSPDDIAAMTGGERMALVCALTDKVWQRDHPGQVFVNDRSRVRIFRSTAEMEGR